MTNMARTGRPDSDDFSVFIAKSNTYAMAPTLRSPAWSKEWPMIDLNIEQYVREHEERVRRLDELYDKIRSPEYNEEEKTNFRHESLKLCREGLATI